MTGMKRKNPWLKFYPTDWRADPGLRHCSLSARGLWIELLGIMHDSEPYGHLDPALTGYDIALLVGSPLKTVRAALAELEMNRVFDRGDKGEIVSRRMVRDHAKALKDQANGSKGGNPQVTGWVNPAVVPWDKAQNPEARIQNGGGGRGASGHASIGSEAFELATFIGKLCGHGQDFIPPEWAGATLTVQSWLNQGWTAEQIGAACREIMAGKRDGPPAKITYFEKGIARFVARLAQPVPKADPKTESRHGRTLTPHQQRLAEHREAIEKYRRDREAGGADGGEYAPS
jgi:hypothetical protein